jgi:hypothetical protein
MSEAFSLTAWVSTRVDQADDWRIVLAVESRSACSGRLQRQVRQVGLVVQPLHRLHGIEPAS